MPNVLKELILIRKIGHCFGFKKPFKLEISKSRNCPSVDAINAIVFLLKILLKKEKKWTLKIQKSEIVILVLNLSPISAVSPIVRFAGDPKPALTGDPLYLQNG